MKPKGNCQECGRISHVSKLKKEIHGRRLLCGKCYSCENNKRYDKKLAVLPKINGSIMELSDNIKSPVRIAKNRKSKDVLLRGEDMVIKKKYGYDQNNLNGDSCSQVKRLRTVLWNNESKKKIKEKEEMIRSIFYKKKKDNMNKNFIDELK